MATSSAAVLPASASGEKLQLAVLDVAKSAQMEHGLRHKDFEGYRQYCTRRLRRIRQCKTVHFLHKEASSADKKARKGVFAQKELTPELATDSKHLQIPLFNAERAWAYAMEMKVEFNASQSGRARQRMGKRLKKAVEWAQKLSEICAAVADERTKLEAEAYSAEMEARWHFERNDAVRALPLLATARSIYQGLAPVGLPRERRLFQQQATEIMPLERMCRFHIARARHAAGHAPDSGAGSDVDAAVAARLASLVAQAEEAAAASVGNSVVTGDGDDVQVAWQGVSIKVEDPGIRKVLVAIRSKEAELAAEAMATGEEAEGAEGMDEREGGESAAREAREGQFMQLLDQYDRGVRAAGQARMKSSEASEKWGAVVTALKFGRLRVLCNHTASVARHALRGVQHPLRLCLVAAFAATSAACPVMGPMPGSRASIAAAASGAGGLGDDSEDLVLPPLALDVVSKLGEAVRTFDQARRVAEEALQLIKGEAGEGAASGAGGGAATDPASGDGAVTGEAVWARKQDQQLRAERCCALALCHEVYASVSASSLPKEQSLGPEGSIAKASALHGLAGKLAGEAEKSAQMDDVKLHAGAGAARCKALAEAHEAAQEIADEDTEYLSLAPGSRRVAPYNALDAMAPGADLLPGDATEALVAAAVLSLRAEDVPSTGQVPSIPLTNWDKPEPSMILPKPLHFDVAFEYTSPPVDDLAERAGMDEEEGEGDEEGDDGDAAGAGSGAASDGAQEEGAGMLGGFVRMFTG